MDLPQEWHEQNQINKLRWFKGNKRAVEFINAYFKAVELWDDLIDKDNPISDEDINDTFLGLMFGLPMCDWFIENRHYYAPLIMASINGFHDANEMCLSDKKHIRNLAFHIRNFGIELHIATAFLTGGYEHMRAVSREIREFFAFESFDEWEFNHG